MSNKKGPLGGLVASDRFGLTGVSDRLRPPYEYDEFAHERSLKCEFKAFACR
jgi:hypothetical protein